MKENKITEWKSALMTMPDTSFFELLRSVFGKIKTPFNKQQLLKDLEKFLLQPDIQKTIADFIDSNDEKIIAAITLFENPAPEKLERFFTEEFSYVQLHDIIVNLEERFIIYRFIDEKKSCLALNPVLTSVLAPFAENMSVLFPQSKTPEKTKKTKTATATLNDRVLAGLLSFVSQYEGTAFYKKEGQLRKQILDAAKICFPGLNLDETLGALLVLGLFYSEEENLHCDEKRFADIALLNARERMEYCAASMIVYKETVSPTDIQAPYYKNRIKEAVNFIHALMDSLAGIYKSSEKETYFSETTLVKLIEILKSRTGYNVNTNNLLEALNKTGLTICANTIYTYENLLTTNNYPLPTISIDSNSILVYPEIAFTDAVELASFLNIKETGAVVRFELEKSSAVRAFDNGITSQHIIETLTRLSGKKLPHTLEWNLKDWEARHGEVSLKKGVVLTLAKDKQYLTQTKPLCELITETLAPGVYLLQENAAEEAATALHNAGVDIVAQLKREPSGTRNKNETSLQENSAHSLQRQSYFPAPVISKASVLQIQPIREEILNHEKHERHENALTQKFHAILEKMPLDKTGRDELSARIDRRLILCESQLKDANIRYEKLEARHMDYAGKQNIAKQAILHESLVEIVYSDKKIYGIPKALEKDGANLILVVTPRETGETVRIPLAKISLLRRIKKSIFEG